MSRLIAKKASNVLVKNRLIDTEPIVKADRTGLRRTFLRMSERNFTMPPPIPGRGLLRSRAVARRRRRASLCPN